MKKLVDKLLKINDVLSESKPSADMSDDAKKRYLETLDVLNMRNRRKDMYSAAKASRTYIHQSTINSDNYNSLSPEIKYLKKTIDEVFDSCAEKEEYNKEIISQIIISNYEIIYEDLPSLTTANLREKSNSYSRKVSNFTFNISNFIKYIGNIYSFIDGVKKRDILFILVVALNTLRELESDFTSKIDEQSAYFLEFIYENWGYDTSETEDSVIQRYLNYIKDKDFITTNITEDDVYDIINTLYKLKTIDIVNNRIRVVEKIIL